MSDTLTLIGGAKKRMALYQAIAAVGFKRGATRKLVSDHYHCYEGKVLTWLVSEAIHTAKDVRAKGWKASHFLFGGAMWGINSGDDYNARYDILFGKGVFWTPEFSEKFNARIKEVNK